MKKYGIHFPALGLIALCLSALLATAWPVYAAEEIKHLSAGITAEDRGPHPEFPLKLVFALKSGNYLAGVTVNFFRDGKLMGTIDDAGPWLFVDLQPASYTVEASLGQGNSKKASFTVGGGSQKMVLITWDHE